MLLSKVRNSNFQFLEYGTIFIGFILEALISNARFTWLEICWWIFLSQKKRMGLKTPSKFETANVRSVYVFSLGQRE